MGAGRPTKYKPELIGKVMEYIEGCKITKDEDGNDTIPIDAVPGMIGFSLWADISHDTLNTWKAKDLNGVDVSSKESQYYRLDEFQHILHKLHKFQAQTMLNGGADGRLNSNIAKLVLGKHGYKESKDITSDGKSIKPSITIG